MLTGAMAADVDTAGDRARDLGEDCVEGNVCKNGARRQGTVHGLVEQLAGILAATGGVACDGVVQRVGGAWSDPRKLCADFVLR
jgi:hypothetical protein